MTSSIALQFTSSGILAMANSGSDTNGSQFFITSAPYRYGDFSYSIFGFLVEGAELLNQLSNVPVHDAAGSNDSVPTSPDHTIKITSVTAFTDTENAVLRLSAPNGTAGTATVTVVATDTVTHETSTQTFQVTVAADTNNNNPFLEKIAPIHLTAGVPYSFDIPAVDVEGDAVYYKAQIGTDGAGPKLDSFA